MGAVIIPARMRRTPPLSGTNPARLGSVKSLKRVPGENTQPEDGWNHEYSEYSIDCIIRFVSTEYASLLTF